MEKFLWVRTAFDIQHRDIFHHFPFDKNQLNVQKHRIRVENVIALFLPTEHPIGSFNTSTTNDIDRFFNNSTPTRKLQSIEKK